ncbi:MULTISPECIES: site-2 protease family protein [unclassified Nonomuraea]|uniref:site-2 protease family protein n=1 Tax=unclassified Nonomuraea TaxID=2593643 RepID=UPI0033CE4D54
MRQTLRFGRVAGIPVGAHWSALGIVALVVVALGSGVLAAAAPGAGRAAYWVAGVVIGLLLMASLLAHELAHALTAKRCGMEVECVTLWALGGVTEFREEARTPASEVATAAAGPVASLLLGGLAYAAAAVLPPGVPRAAAAWLAMMNLILGVFNLLPGSPLDGGRVLHGLLWSRYGDRHRADVGAARAGYGIGLTLTFAGFAVIWVWSPLGGMWLVITGWYIAGAARGEIMSRAARRGLGGVSVRDVMTATPDLAPAWLTVQGLVDAVVLGSHQSVFPVVGFDGAPLGAVSLESLLAVPAERRGETRVEALVATQTPPRVLSPDDDATALLERPSRTGGLRAVVVEDGLVTGMITDADLGRTLQQALLRPAATV